MAARQVSRELNFSSVEVLTSLRLVQSARCLKRRARHALKNAESQVKVDTQVIFKGEPLEDCIKLCFAALHVNDSMHWCSWPGVELSFWFRDPKFDEHLAANHRGPASSCAVGPFCSFHGIYLHLFVQTLILLISPDKAADEEEMLPAELLRDA